MPPQIEINQSKLVADPFDRLHGCCGYVAEAGREDESRHIHSEAKDGMSDRALQASHVRLRCLGSRGSQGHQAQAQGPEDTQQQPEYLSRRLVFHAIPALRSDGRSTVNSTGAATRTMPGYLLVRSGRGLRAAEERLNTLQRQIGQAHV